MDKLHKVIIYKMKGINYIGSTKCLFNRTATHYRDYLVRKQKIYKFITDNKLKIELIPLAYVFVSKRGGEMVEQYFINKNDSIKNGYNTKNAYGLDFKKYKKNKAIYGAKREQKKETKLYRKKYQQSTNGKLNKARSYQKHKVKINKRRSEKIVCPKCNSIMRRDSISKHKKTSKCLNFNVAI